MAEYAHYSALDPEFFKVASALPPQPAMDIASMSPDAVIAAWKVLSDTVTLMNRARYEPLVDGPSRSRNAMSTINPHSGGVRSVDLRGQGLHRFRGPR
jgi:hypothetical protein